MVQQRLSWADEIAEGYAGTFPEGASRAEGHMMEVDPATADGRQPPQLQRDLSIASQGPQSLRRARQRQQDRQVARCSGVRTQGRTLWGNTQEQGLERLLGLFAMLLVH